ncbi:MAG: ATP-binding cassette domain-containing protein [Proteobacteria bacterium]|nr:ATP-binding cassette domain-containing protein [Pseudomonadota bacterium]
MLEIKQLAKTFGTIEAIKDVSFTARDGQITTLLGANGSGKTTTLRCITGLIKPTHGSVVVDGIEVAKNPLKARKNLGFVADEFGLYPRLTAREHLVYYAGFHNLYGDHAAAAAEKTITILHMEHIADRRTGGFSLGERAKVALARAMVHSPQNFMLDEPTRGLDVLSIRLLRGLLKELKEEGRTILFSSHVMAEVEALSDRVVIISGGIVRADGPPGALKEKAKTRTLEDAFIKITGYQEKAA